MSFKKSRKVSAFQVYSEEQVQSRHGRSYRNFSPPSPSCRNNGSGSRDRRTDQGMDRRPRNRRRNSEDDIDTRYRDDVNRKRGSQSPSSVTRRQYPDDPFYDRHGSSDRARDRDRFNDRRWDDIDTGGRGRRSQADDNYLIVDMKGRDRHGRRATRYSDSDDECLHHSLRHRKHDASFSSEDDRPMWGSDHFDDDYRHNRKRSFSDQLRDSLSPPPKLWREDNDDDDPMLAVSQHDSLSKKKKGKGKRNLKGKGKIGAAAAVGKSGKIPSLMDLEFPPGLAAKNLDLDPTSTDILPSSNSKISQLGFRNRRNNNGGPSLPRYERDEELKDGRRFSRQMSDEEDRSHSFGDHRRNRRSPDFDRYGDTGRSRRDESNQRRHSGYSDDYRDRNLDLSSSNRRNQRNSSDVRQRDHSPVARTFSDSEQDSDREGARRSWREERRDRQPNKQAGLEKENKARRQVEEKPMTLKQEVARSREPRPKEASAVQKKEDKRREVENKPDPSARFHIAKCSGGLAVFLTHPQEICLRGRAQVQVLAGSISIMGYKIAASEKSFNLYSPTSSSLLTMQTTSPESDKKVLRKVLKSLEVDEKDVKDFMTGAVILMAQQLPFPVGDYICTLPPYTQLFKFNIEKCAVTDSVDSQEMVNLGAAFFPVQQAPNLPLKWSGDMESALEKWVSQVQKGDVAPVAVLCGGQNAGKSTFARYMVNAALNIIPKVCYFDCDVGQTEFCPSGSVALTIVEEPILGPPFCHQKRAERMCFYGLTSPADGPSRYMQCLQYVWEAYQALDPAPPLIVNTMGWNEGLGLKLFVDVMKLTCPDMVIQFNSAIPYLNFPPINTEFSALQSGWFYNTEPVTDKEERMKGVKQHELITVESLVNTRIDSNKIKLTPRNIRDLSLLAHLMEGFHPSVTLQSAVPYAVPWCKLAVHVCHSHVANRLVWAALNASVVALCSADLSEARRMNDNGPLFFDESPICDCLGYGVVRAVDVEQQIVYIITSLPRSLLVKVNTLLKGAINIPDQLFLKQTDFEEVPYIDALAPAMALAPVRQRSRMPRRTGAAPTQETV